MQLIYRIMNTGPLKSPPPPPPPQSIESGCSYARLSIPLPRETYRLPLAPELVTNGFC